MAFSLTHTLFLLPLFSLTIMHTNMALSSPASPSSPPSHSLLHPLRKLVLPHTAEPTFNTGEGFTLRLCTCQIFATGCHIQIKSALYVNALFMLKCRALMQSLGEVRTLLSLSELSSLSGCVSVNTAFSEFPYSAPLFRLGAWPSCFFLLFFI